MFLTVKTRIPVVHRRIYPGIKFQLFTSAFFVWEMMNLNFKWQHFPHEDQIFLFL